MNHSARALLALALASTIPAQGKNLLFYGNSYTYYSWGYGVPELVQLIAIEAGHPAPNFEAALVGGMTLQFFATDPAQVAVISNALPPGQTWDHVIIQGHELEATNTGGHNVVDFLNNSIAITTNVRNHSPAAGTVMFQTWARAWGHWNYPIPWPVPLDMHYTVRGNYHTAVSNINAAHGAGTARNAAVGDGLALLEFEPTWYEADKSHPSPAMIMLAAMCIYTSVYGQTVCEINFNPTGALATSLASKGLGETDWNHMAGIADRCADPALRRYPGSGDQLLLETGTDSNPMLACPENRMTTGTLVQMQLRSMNGVYDPTLGWILIDLIPTGTPIIPSGPNGEIQLRPGSMAILITSAGLANPLSFSFQMPFSWPGNSVLVQGLGWRPSVETGNPWYTTTDAHEFVFF